MIRESFIFMGWGEAGGWWDLGVGATRIRKKSLKELSKA